MLILILVHAQGFASIDEWKAQFNGPLPCAFLASDAVGFCFR
ncbi:hypothetical protein [Zhongshania aliphaticivorans]